VITREYEMIDAKCETVGMIKNWIRWCYWRSRSNIRWDDAMEMW